jgi:hypothetical protein
VNGRRSLPGADRWIRANEKETCDHTDPPLLLPFGHRGKRLKVLPVVEEVEAIDKLVVEVRRLLLDGALPGL